MSSNEIEDSRPEQRAFEAWASNARFDMSMHPMHYLFLNNHTSAAREGWKAGMKHAREALRAELREKLSALGLEALLDDVDSVPDPEPALFTFGYTNWQGQMSERTAIPLKVYYGSNEWHPEPQWLLMAKDIEKGEIRHFALNDILGLRYGRVIRLDGESGEAIPTPSNLR